jgi:integrase
MRVRGKGSKERTVPAPPVVAATIADHLSTRAHRVRDPAEGAVFLGNRGARLHRRGLDHLVTSWFTRAGVRQPPGEAAHAFRHTYAVGLVPNGAGLPAKNFSGIATWPSPASTPHHRRSPARDCPGGACSSAAKRPPGEPLPQADRAALQPKMGYWQPPP